MVPAFPNYSQELKIRVFKMFTLDRHFQIWRMISIYLMETPMLYLILVLYTYFSHFYTWLFFKTQTYRCYQLHKIWKIIKFLSGHVVILCKVNSTETI